MDDFSIKYEHNSEEYLKMHKVLWALRAKGLYTNLKTHTIYAGFILLIAIASWYFSTIDNVLIFVSLFYLMYLAITLVNILKSKRNYLKRISQISERLELGKFEFTFEFNTQSLNYTDSEKSMSFNWSLFAHYVKHKGFLILYITDFEALQYVFELKDDSNTEKIMQFVESKINQLEL
jgi:hypothetical protein